MQEELNVVVADREVTRRTHIPAVDAGRELMTIWAGNRGTDRSSFNQKYSIACVDRVNSKPGQGKRKHKHLSI
jgi:hypothetical protein